MCIPNALQQHILEITDDGKTVAAFFYATMQGETPNAKIHHRMEAAKQLSKLCLTSVCLEPRSDIVEWHAEEHVQKDENTPSPVNKKGWNRSEETGNPTHPVKSNVVTDFDIVNYQAARLIREETNDGYHIAHFLARVMRGTAGKGNPISPADRMAAAKELMNRGLGRFGDAPHHRITDCQENLIHSGISRYIRERTEHGLDAARFLLDVASGQAPSFSMHQRIVATRELVRRSWDTNYDAVTPEDIAAYHERQETIESTDYDIRLQEWREKERQDERAAQEARDMADEDEAQLESGIFAHLTNTEITRYEAMSANDRQEFIEQQRQRHTSRLSTAPQPTNRPESTPETGENREGINWNTLLQDISALSPTPALTRPEYPVKPQTHIRSP